MAMQWLERELRQTGESQDKLNADLISAMLTHRGKDIPLPTTETQKPETVRFSSEAREALEKAGFRVYELTGQSVHTLKDSGRKFWSTWHSGNELEELPSRLSEVAIDPTKLFLPTSNDKTLQQQLDMVAKHSADVAQRFPGTEAILGEVPDYTELTFAHLDATGERLFGQGYDYNYTRTQTPVGQSVAGVGDFARGIGLHVDYWYPDDRYDNLFAAPLVVPASSAAIETK